MTRHPGMLFDGRFCAPFVIAFICQKRLAEKKHSKNQTEKDRKDEITALIKDMASLVMGQEKENVHLQELTRARLTRACLSEIPRTIIQFYTDGKSPTERPLSITFFISTITAISLHVYEYLTQVFTTSFNCN